MSVKDTNNTNKKDLLQNQGTVYDSPNQDPGWVDKWHGPDFIK